jgi:ribosomal protein S13
MKSILFWQERLSAQKPFQSAMWHMKGVNKSTAEFTKTIFGISQKFSIGAICQLDRQAIVSFFFENFFLSRRLDRERVLWLSALGKIGPRRVRRRYMALPVRGQRTHSNASTARKLLKNL